MTTPEELQEIRRIRKELQEEFPTHVVNQLNRVFQELEVLRDRLAKLIEITEKNNVRRECLHESDYY